MKTYKSRKRIHGIINSVSLLALPYLWFTGVESVSDVLPVLGVIVVLGFGLSFLTKGLVACGSCKASQAWYKPKGAEFHCFYCGEEVEAMKGIGSGLDIIKIFKASAIPCSCGTRQTTIAQAAQTHCRWCGENLDTCC